MLTAHWWEIPFTKLACPDWQKHDHWRIIPVVTTTIQDPFMNGITPRGFTRRPLTMGWSSEKEPNLPTSSLNLFQGFDRNGWRFVTELAGHHFKTSKWWKKHANLSNKYCEIWPPQISGLATCVFSTLVRYDLRSSHRGSEHPGPMAE